MQRRAATMVAWPQSIMFKTGAAMSASLLLEAVLIPLSVGTPSGPYCSFLDGSPARQFYVCDGETNYDTCCPYGSDCLPEGLCIEPAGSNYVTVFQGACTTDSECVVPCGSEIENGIAYFVSCGGNQYCCGHSEGEDCCDESFPFVFSGKFQLKSPSDIDDDEGDYSSYTSRRPGYGGGGDSTVVEAVTTTQTISATGTPSEVPAEEAEDLDDHDAKKLVAIGAGLGVGGALLLVAIIALVFIHVRRKRRRRAEQGQPAKGMYGSEGAGTSSLNTPIDSTQSSNHPANLPPAAQPVESTPVFRGDPLESPRSVSPLPPAPPYSPPQYESGDYQYLVVDGPSPGNNNSNSNSATNSGGLPVGPDGKPRLED